MERVPVTPETSRYSDSLSSFKVKDGFTLVIGVARKESSPQGHIDHEDRFAFVTLRRNDYRQLWREIRWSSTGSILIQRDQQGRFTGVEYRPDVEKNCT